MADGNQEEQLSPLINNVPSPPERPKQPPRWLLIVIMFGLILAAGAWWFLAGQSATIPTSLGFRDHTPLSTPASLDQEVTATGNCLASQLLQAGGLNEAGHQSYLLTLNLKANPTSEAALATILATADCQEEVQTVLTGVAKDLTTGLYDPPVLTVSYKAKSGQRFLIPE